jgi:hypothetical protein
MDRNDLYIMRSLNALHAKEYIKILFRLAHETGLLSWHSLLSPDSAYVTT